MNIHRHSVSRKLAYMINVLAYLLRRREQIITGTGNIFVTLGHINSFKSMTVIWIFMIRSLQCAVGPILLRGTLLKSKGQKSVPGLYFY